MKKGFWRGILTGGVVGTVVGAVLSPLMSPEGRSFWRRNRDLIRRFGKVAGRLRRRAGRRVRLR